MPTLLQYCDLLNTVIDEQIKRATVSSYLYYTHKKSYYPQPQLQQLVRVNTVCATPKKKTAKISADD